MTDALCGCAAVLRDLDRLESEAEGNEAQEGAMLSPVPGELDSCTSRCWGLLGERACLSRRILGSWWTS